MQRLYKTSLTEATAQTTGPRLQYELKKEEMEKQCERASIFCYQAKVHLYSGQTPQQKLM